MLSLLTPRISLQIWMNLSFLWKTPWDGEVRIQRVVGRKNSLSDRKACPRNTLKFSLFQHLSLGATAFETPAHNGLVVLPREIWVRLCKTAHNHSLFSRKANWKMTNKTIASSTQPMHNGSRIDLASPTMSWLIWNVSPQREGNFWALSLLAAIY